MCINKSVLKMPSFYFKHNFFKISFSSPIISHISNNKTKNNWWKFFFWYCCFHFPPTPILWLNWFISYELWTDVHAIRQYHFILKTLNAHDFQFHFWQPIVILPSIVWKSICIFRHYFAPAHKHIQKFDAIEKTEFFVK